MGADWAPRKWATSRTTSTRRLRECLAAVPACNPAIWDPRIRRDS